ncbi:hypothetical protein CHLNCDRAFT_133963 [Chlorella variabilis]|uniref:Dolichol-phosphate mannosyltransferase subunit 3 n=1 Tax=Chlorella variabilis TaxID=554065 RepID=E1ZEN8_CHLVA|nr:hypothetical protein CHLNCDRAFT_133963 [Chlorella variabilis]EFN55694.1 hypothetical protein CHLNCDRAFT_133963 [Chlorella variabilis]|eukprot:XP_005847796.1 hypothetical protein CHLNCDRAFT_133963 [Chlorella variabilis]
MLRIFRLSAVGLLLLAAWAALLQQTTEEPARTWVLLAPLLALVVFGAYLATALLYGVATFRTVPEEAELLQKDIARARADLARRGIKY